jgi:transposase
MDKVQPLNENDRRKNVYSFYLSNKERGKKFTVDHFKAEKIAPSTVYDIIKREEAGVGPERQAGSGRPAKKMSKKNLAQLCKMFDQWCLGVNYKRTPVFSVGVVVEYSNT